MINKFHLVLLHFFMILFAQDYVINSGNFYYSPSSLTINVGETIEWYNDGGYHDVNGLENSITGVSFNNPQDFYLDPISGPASIGSFTFTVPGTYQYDCSVGSHAVQGMVGTITVVSGNSNSGCTDPQAYNCDGSLNGNYVTDIGGIVYDFTCNGNTPAGSESCSEDSFCQGYYNPNASEDDGSCRYYQAPTDNQVVFDVQDNGININWDLFIPPSNSIIESFHVQRCVENCTWLPEFTPSGTSTATDTFDEYAYEPGVEIKYAIAVKYTNNPYWGWAIGASYISPASCPSLGDLNGDGGYNVLDIVGLANCVLANNCTDLPNGCAGDMNGDGGYNVLDIVALANCVLANNCGGRVDDATASSLSITDKLVSIEADGFIGGVQMTINHGDDFTIDITDRALFADYLTTDNQTRLLVINPETEDLFTYDGQFEIIEIMVANTQYEVSVELPLAASFSLSEAYPNPFNPKTALILSLNQGSNINIGVYNIKGNLISNLASGFIDGGTHSLYWDASEFPSGVYFVKAVLEDEVITQKLMLLK